MRIATRTQGSDLLPLVIKAYNVHRQTGPSENKRKQIWIGGVNMELIRFAEDLTVLVVISHVLVRFSLCVHNKL